MVLRGLDLDVKPGESMAIVGATASGKSTVARLLLRFYDAQRGTVSLDGIDVRNLRLADLRKSVAVVFEDTLLFNDSVAANIAFADPNTPQDRIEEAARLAGAHDFILELPDGYETVLGERGYSLSGGQRQRVEGADHEARGDRRAAAQRARQDGDQDAGSFVHGHRVILARRGPTTGEVIVPAQAGRARKAAKSASLAANSTSPRAPRNSS